MVALRLVGKDRLMQRRANLFCNRCGSQLNEVSAFCARCGKNVTPPAGRMAIDVSPKSRLATSLLAWFLGQFGAHRFYAGRAVTAVLMLSMGILSGVCWFGGLLYPLAAGDDIPSWDLLLIGGLLYFAVWVWSIIDFVFAVTGNLKDGQGRVIEKW